MLLLIGECLSSRTGGLYHELEQKEKLRYMSLKTGGLYEELV